MTDTNTKSGRRLRAGLLPYIMRDGVPEFLFMKPSHAAFGGDRYQIAKGVVERGESAEQAAMAEASEELGLDGTNLRSVILLGTFLGRTEIYIGEVVNPNDLKTPHYETASVAWMKLDQFAAEGRELHVAVVRAAVKFITENLQG